MYCTVFFFFFHLAYKSKTSTFLVYFFPIMLPFFCFRFLFVLWSLELTLGTDMGLNNSRLRWRRFLSFSLIFASLVHTNRRQKSVLWFLSFSNYPLAHCLFTYDVVYFLHLYLARIGLWLSLLSLLMRRTGQNCQESKTMIGGWAASYRVNLWRCRVFDIKCNTHSTL